MKKANIEGDANTKSETQVKEMKSEPRKDEYPSTAAKDSSKRKRRKRKRKRKRRNRKASKCDEKDDNRSREQDGDSSELVRLKCREMLIDALKTGGECVSPVKTKPI